MNLVVFCTIINAIKFFQGAGDAFVGAMAYFLAMFDSGELSMNEILRRSCEVAKYSVQKLGTQTSFPHKADLPSSLFK